MAFPRVSTFQSRILLAILVVVLVPAAITAIAGTVTLRGIGTRSGTLGAWDSVAESGQELIASLDSAGVEDPVVRAAAERHRSALSESVRLSRLYAFVADRFVQVLPMGVLLIGIVVLGLAFLTARALARGFSRPIEELVGWTERIGHQEPLPPSQPEALAEFRTLKTSLRTMAQQLNEGRERDIESARLRSWTDLARRVAHEIKNPLTAMRMAARSLPTDGGSGPATVLVEEIARLDSMARTFSQFGKMPEGPRSGVDLGELLTTLATRETSARVQMNVEGAVMVIGHYDALLRAFRNLLVNAVEADPQVARPKIEVTVRAEGDSARVEVADFGPGIPEELLQEIWNPDVSTKRSGTGLGLAIVRRTIELHAGTVEAVNRPGGGAVFLVRLPLSTTPTT